MNHDAFRDTWLMFQRERGCSIDRMLCDPALRSDFLAAAATGCVNEQDLLWTLVSFRKKKNLPSTLR